MSVFLDSALIAYGFFVACSGFVFIKQLGPQFIQNVGLPAWLVSSKFAFLLVLTLFPLAPMCLTRTLSALRYASLLSVISSVVCIFLLMFEMPRKLTEMQDRSTHAGLDSPDFLPAHWWVIDPDTNFLSEVPLALSICLFALTNHVNLFAAKGELALPSARRMNKVLVRAVLLQTLTYWIVGVCGFLSLGPACKAEVPSTPWPSCTPRNLLASPRFTTFADIIAQGAMVIIVLISVVLNLGAGCRAMFSLWEQLCSKRLRERGPSEEFLAENLETAATPESSSCLVHTAVKLIPLFLALAVGVLVDSIATLMAILGGFCVSSFGFSIPLASAFGVRHGAHSMSMFIVPSTPLAASAAHAQDSDATPSACEEHVGCFGMGQGSARCSTMAVAAVLTFCSMVGYVSVVQAVWQMAQHNGQA